MTVYPSKSQGVTLLELLLVVGILAILATVLTPFFSNFVTRNNLDLAAEVVVGSIRKTQNYSMNAKNNSVWGICTNAGKIRIYTGSCASPTQREDTTIPAGITISGLSGTTFSKFRGEPSSGVTITIRSGIKEKSIVINNAGGLDIN